MSLNDFPPEAESDALLTTLKDRRRAGRSGRVSPQLTPLLRNPATVDIPAPPADHESAPGSDAAPGLDAELSPDAAVGPDADLAPIRGFAIGLMLSVPIWAIIVWAVWALLHRMHVMT